MPEVDDERRPVIGNAAGYDLHSSIVGDEFRVLVAECGAEPTCTLVVTDANGLFGLTVDTIRLMQLPALVGPVLVVGIGYPGAATLRNTIQLRGRDLTPTRSDMLRRSGGADDFAGFLQNELMPWIGDRYPRAAQDLTYFGHSLGGLFGAYALITRPHLFDHVIASSPSLWWDGEVIFDLERVHARQSDRLAGDIFFGIGSLETDEGRRAEATHLPEGHPAKPPAARLDMVADLRRFVAQIDERGYGGLSMRSVEIPDEFHATVPAVVLSRALRYLHLGHPAPSATTDG